MSCIYQIIKRGCFIRLNTLPFKQAGAIIKSPVCLKGSVLLLMEKDICIPNKIGHLNLIDI